MKDEILELETRRKIYDLVSSNPGLHLSKIADILKMRISLVEYHLLFLERHNTIRSVKESGYTRYYIEGEIGTADKKILSILRQKVPLNIILYLLKGDNSQHKDILKNVNVSPSTLSYHLKKLVNNEIVNVNSQGEDRGYSINDKEQIIKILVQYKPYNLFDSFKEIWADLSIE